MTQAASLWTSAGQHASALSPAPSTPGCPPEAAAPLARLPPSAQRVYATLARGGPQTHRELLAATSLPGRTVRYAVGRLREVGLIASRGNLRDLRQSLFFLAPPESRARPTGSAGYRLL